MRGQTRYLLHCVKRITLASAGKENSTELMFAPHPNPLPRERAKSRAHFCFTGRAEHRTSDSLSPWDREKNRAHFVLREEQNTARAIPSPVREGEKRKAFCFTGGAEHCTNDSLCPWEREKSGALFVLWEEQNTARAIPSLRGRGRKQSAFCFTGGAEHRTCDSLSPWERVRVRASNRTHYPSTIVLNRQVQQRRPCSSKITISQLWFCRPRCSG